MNQTLMQTVSENWSMCIDDHVTMDNNYDHHDDGVIHSSSDCSVIPPGELQLKSVLLQIIPRSVLRDVRVNHRQTALPPNRLPFSYCLSFSGSRRTAAPAVIVSVDGVGLFTPRRLLPSERWIYRPGFYGAGGGAAFMNETFPCSRQPDFPIFIFFFFFN